jgi:hypothetical protein
MKGDSVLRYVGGLVFGTVVALFLLMFLQSLLSSSAALQPGDPLYSAQMGLMRDTVNILPWLIPGTIAVIAVVLRLLQNPFR